MLTPIERTSYLGLQAQSTLSAVDLLLTHPTLMDSLRKALTGNYSVILSLLGCLDHGTQAKRLVDRVIDSCKYSFVFYRYSVC